MFDRLPGDGASQIDVAKIIVLFSFLLKYIMHKEKGIYAVKRIFINWTLR